jgi:hypothetical protein
MRSVIRESGRATSDAANEAANGVGSALTAVGSKLRTGTTVVSKWRVFDAHFETGAHTAARLGRRF